MLKKKSTKNSIKIIGLRISVIGHLKKGINWMKHKSASSKQSNLNMVKAIGNLEIMKR